MISKEVIDQVLSYGGTNIVSIVSQYMELRKEGNVYRGCCPFHVEKTPSFTVDPNRQTWHCFGSCAEGGNVITFIKKIEGIRFPEAVAKLAAMGGITIPGAGETKEEKERKVVLAALSKAELFFQHNLAENTNGGKAYVEKRMTPEMVEAFGIGYAPKNSGKALLDHLRKLRVPDEISEKAGLIRKDDKGEYRDVFWGGRVMFPIRNKSGVTIAFAGRSIDDAPKFKYINSPETLVYKKMNALFGLDKADLSSGEVYVVEGYLDLMQMWAKGYRNVVAACGTAFTQHHIAELKRQGVRRLVLLFDGDAAGQKATQRTIALAIKEELKVSVFALPDGQDPDSFFKDNGVLVTPLTGLEYLEVSGVELTGHMADLRRLERLEKGMLWFAENNPEVAAVLVRRGKLDELFDKPVADSLMAKLQERSA